MEQNDKNVGCFGCKFADPHYKWNHEMKMYIRCKKIKEWSHIVEKSTCEHSEQVQW